MRKDPVTMALLYDYYGGVLTSKQAEIYETYYNADLSLSEIAENLGITRQGVYDALSRAERILMDLEEKLGLVARFGAQRELAEQIGVWLNELERTNVWSNLQSATGVASIREALAKMVEM